MTPSPRSHPALGQMFERQHEHAVNAPLARFPTADRSPRYPERAGKLGLRQTHPFADSFELLGLHLRFVANGNTMSSAVKGFFDAFFEDGMIGYHALPSNHRVFPR